MTTNGYVSRSEAAANGTITTEHTARTEAEAHRMRREMIDAGVAVSLIAYCGFRDVFAFDSYR